MTNDIVPKKLETNKNIDIIDKLKELSYLKSIFQFRNIHVKKCLDDTGMDQIGKGYQLLTCDKTNDNQWFRFRLPLVRNYSGYYNIVGHNKRCVSAKIWNGKLSQEECGDGNSDDLLWKAEKYGNGWNDKLSEAEKHEDGWIIKNIRGRLVMHNKGNKFYNGNPIFAWDKTDEDLRAQKWAIENVQTQDKKNEEMEKFVPEDCTIRINWWDSHHKGVKDITCVVGPSRKRKEQGTGIDISPDCTSGWIKIEDGKLVKKLHNLSPNCLCGVSFNRFNKDNPLRYKSNYNIGYRGIPRYIIYLIPFQNHVITYWTGKRPDHVKIMCNKI